MIEPAEIEGSVGAEGIHSGEPSKTFKSGRICATPDCRTVLSIYNSGNYCSLHEPNPLGRLHVFPNSAA